MRRTAVVGIALVALAGCSGADDGDTDVAPGDAVEQPDVSPSPPEDDETPTEEPTEAAEPAGDAATVDAATTSLGEVLVDGDGMTLYMFDPDAETGESTCYDDCAVAWPPLLTEGEATVGEGLDDSLLGTVERTDGTTQVTYGDWPLYLWQNDTAPGETTGQAVNDVWWVVGTDGEPIRTMP
ncbi:hypothetical protein [uncultured Cellulomonas sp.]|uniref:hypothetical protein n=1 Tax=uncultured Cellulomonas sp. TaxID=189682 RepID=UPI002622919B|nr:hypothetical protein [uncultured Cellulomonas sp.]